MYNFFKNAQVFLYVPLFSSILHSTLAHSCEFTSLMMIAIVLLRRSRRTQNRGKEHLIRQSRLLSRRSSLRCIVELRSFRNDNRLRLRPFEFVYCDNLSRLGAEP